MFQTVAQKRFRQLEELNSAFPSTPAKPVPTVTYGKRNRPLPLQGTQFLRQDTYSLPPDDDEDEEDDDEEDLVPIRKGTSRSWKKEPDPGDSPLSEDELSAAYTSSSASRILSLISASAFTTSSSNTSLDHDKSISGSKKGIARPVPKTAAKLVYPVEKKAVADKTPRARSQAPRKRAAEPVSAKQTSKPKPESTKARTATRSKAARTTRLPVNELLLVPFSSDEPAAPSAKENDSDQEDQDPITNITSSSQKRALSPHHDGGDDSVKAPLTTIRKRLKTPRFTHKSVAALRKKQSRRSSIFRTNDETFNLGDGFESSELKLDHCLTFAKRQRKALKPLLLGFGALQLQSGPLPQVNFESSSSKLKLEAAPEEQSCRLAQEDHRSCSTRCDYSVSRDAKRRVSFSDRVLSDMVREELSSIGAPRRPISVSPDQSESDLEEYDDDNEEEVDKDEASDNGAEQDIEPKRPVSTPPSNQRVQSHSKFLRKSPLFERSGNAVTPTVPIERRIGLPPRRLSSRSRAMEVDEAILEGLDDALPTSRASAQQEPGRGRRNDP